MHSSFECEIKDFEFTDEVNTRNAEISQAFDQLLVATEKAKWEKFNSNQHLGVLLANGNDEIVSKLSYTHAIVDKQIEKLFNQTDKNLLQFGASNGIYLKEKQPEYQVLAYDYSSEAERKLTANKIPTRNVDLNALTTVAGSKEPTCKLACENQLKEDLSKPSTILLIRLLEYLKEDALIIFLHTLIKNAKPGTVFVIGGNVTNTMAELKDTQKSPNAQTENFIASFFAARTDMEFLLFKKMNKRDQAFVIRKRMPEGSHAALPLSVTRGLTQ